MVDRDVLPSSSHRRARVLLDLLVVLIAFAAMLTLRFEGDVPGRYWSSFWAFIPVVAAVYLFTIVGFGLHSREPRPGQLLVAGVVTGLLVIAIDVLLGPLLPISVAIAGSVVAIVGVGVLRLVDRRRDQGSS